MKKRINLYIGIFSLIAFIVWTVLVKFVDLAPIGPNASYVGFSSINGPFHNLTGVNFTIYDITDWLGFVTIFIMVCFFAFGLYQLIKRKGISKVDFNILMLGVFYLATLTVYVLFEFVVINRRPVLINNILEASYTSSTTLLALCVVPTAIMQLKSRIKQKTLRICVIVALLCFMSFMVIGRIISGVHWITDIIGGALISVSLVSFYSCVCKFD